jgi:hypothetical protein
MVADVFCAQCGQTLDSEHRFCAACGAPAAGANDVPSAVGETPASGAAPPTPALRDIDPVAQYLAFARIAKTVALLCLFLPWVTVSCAGQRLASINGVSLMMGTATMRDPASGAAQTRSGSPEILMYLVLAAIGFALFASFAWPRRKGATAALYACGAAVLLACAEVFVLIPQHLYQAMARSQPRPSPFGASLDTQFGTQMETGMSQVIRVEPASGFWLTVLALAAALVFNWMIRQRGPGEDSTAP